MSTETNPPEYLPDPGSAAERLRLHNLWRRGEIDLDPKGWHTPAAIDQAIDEVLAENAAYKNQATP